MKTQGVQIKHNTAIGSKGKGLDKKNDIQKSSETFRSRNKITTFPRALQPRMGD